MALQLFAVTITICFEQIEIFTLVVSRFFFFFFWRNSNEIELILIHIPVVQFLRKVEIRRRRLSSREEASRNREEEEEEEEEEERVKLRRLPFNG